MCLCPLLPVPHLLSIPAVPFPAPCTFKPADLSGFCLETKQTTSSRESWTQSFHATSSALGLFVTCSAQGTLRHLLNARLTQPLALRKASCNVKTCLLLCAKKTSGQVPIRTCHQEMKLHSNQDPVEKPTTSSTLGR